MTESGEWGNYPYAGNRHIAQIMAAAPGWRVAERMGFRSVEQAEMAPDDALYWIDPIVAWALVEDLDGGKIYTVVLPVKRTDTTYCDISDDDDHILAPGEEMTPTLIAEFRERAITTEQARARRAAEARTAS